MHGRLFPGRRPCQPTRAARGVLISSVLVGFLATPISAWGVAIFIGSARLSVWVSSPLDLIFIVKIVKIFLSGRPARDGESRMTYVIGEPCVDVLDRACVQECPVDCIHEGHCPPQRTARLSRRCRQAGRRGCRHAIRRRASSAAVACPGALRQRGGSVGGAPRVRTGILRCLPGRHGPRAGPATLILFSTS